MPNQSLSKGLLNKLFFIKLSINLFSNGFNRLPSSTPDSASSGFSNKPLKPATVKLCHGSTANQSACKFTGFSSCLNFFLSSSLQWHLSTLVENRKPTHPFQVHFKAAALALPAELCHVVTLCSRAHPFHDVVLGFY